MSAPVNNMDYAKKTPIKDLSGSRSRVSGLHGVCNKFTTKQGFTLIELLISIGILVVLFAIVTINLSTLPSNTLEAANRDTLINDIRAQQTLAMADGVNYGIHFEDNSYTLFKGDSYTVGSAGNFVVNLDTGIRFTNITLPNSSIVFSAGSGDVVNYSSISDSFTIDNQTTGKTFEIRINKYGADY